MRVYDIFLIFVLALIPYAHQNAWVPIFTQTQFIPFYRLFLGFVMCYFVIKCITIFFDNNHKEALIQISIQPDPLDFISGLAWGLVIYKYYELDNIALLFWIILGIAIIWIGFLGSTVIHNKKGIRAKKGSTWLPWNSVESILLNSAFFTIKTKDNHIYPPILAKKISKTQFNLFSDRLNKLGENKQIPILNTLENATLLTYIEAPNISEEEVLDDVFTKNEYLIMLSEEGVVFADIPQILTWKHIYTARLLKEDRLIIRFRQSWLQTKTKILYKNDFEIVDWLKLMDWVEKKIWVKI